MPELVLAQLKPSGEEGVQPAFRWAHLREDVGANRARVEPLSAAGIPSGNVVTAQAQHLDLASGCPGLLAITGRPPESAVWGNPGDENADEVHCARGVLVGVDRERFLPSAVPALPGALGPARLAARSSFLQAPQYPTRFALRWALEAYRGRAEADGLGGATWLDVALVPHQIAVVRHVLASPSVRHVLADEVGLGKTIEALMIWAALSTQDPSLKTLIVAPRSIIPQWCIELRRRSERAPNARRYEDLPPVFAKAADGAFRAFDVENERGTVLTEPDGLAELEKHALPVDLLIVDEAHELNEDQKERVAKLAARAKHVLLLTATPREAGRQTGAARRKKTQLAWALSVVDPKVPSKTPTHELDKRIEESLDLIRQADARIAEGVLEPTPVLLAKAEGLAVELTNDARRDVRSLARQATLFERVVRTQRRSVEAEALSERCLHRVHVELRDEEVAVFEALRDADDEDRLSTARRLACSSWDALAGEQTGKTSEVKERLKVVREARVDSKLEALLDLCARLWSEDSRRKIVIRCEYAQTLSLVCDRLSRLLLDGGLRRSTEGERQLWQGDAEDIVGPVARLTQNQDSMIDVLAEKGTLAGSMLAHVFAFERAGPGGAVALVAADVAATGLNLQFATDLIFYDLPWRPLLAEQWIGRLDRLGRRHGQVAVHALTHPAMPTHALVDLYENIGLFAKGFRGAPEDDLTVGKLIERADAGIISWQAVQEQAAAIARSNPDEEDDAAASRALDLEPVDPAGAQEEVSRAERLLRAFDAVGFSVAQDEKYRHAYELTWPASKADVLALPRHRAVLRRDGWSGGQPDQIAAQNEKHRALRLEIARLGWERWRRSAATDYLTPRHPLVVEAREELLADPTLAVGRFKIPTSEVPVTPGRYIIALCRLDSAVGALAALWRCGAAAPFDGAGDPLDDEELARIWEVIAAGLRRAMTVRVPPSTLARGWRLERSGMPLSLAKPVDGAVVDEIAGAISKGASLKSEAVGHGFLQYIEEIERPPATPEDELLGQVQAVLDASARHARLLGRDVVQGRTRLLDAASDTSGMRGIRDQRARSLRLADIFFERLGSLNQHADVAAREMLTPRVLSAAIVEVAP